MVLFGNNFQILFRTKSIRFLKTQNQAALPSRGGKNPKFLWDPRFWGRIPRNTRLGHFMISRISSEEKFFFQKQIETKNLFPLNPFPRFEEKEMDLYVSKFYQALSQIHSLIKD